MQEAQFLAALSLSLSLFCPNSHPLNASQNYVVGLAHKNYLVIVYREGAYI